MALAWALLGQFEKHSLSEGTKMNGYITAGLAHRLKLDTWKPKASGDATSSVSISEWQDDVLGCAADLHELAGDSLELLKVFLYDERFLALFHLDVYGSIVGMFELNNLGEHS